MSGKPDAHSCNSFFDFGPTRPLADSRAFYLPYTTVEIDLHYKISKTAEGKEMRLDKKIRVGRHIVCPKLV